MLAIGGAPEFGSYRLGRERCGLGEALSCLRGDLEKAIADRKPDLIAREAPYVPVPRQPRLVRAGSITAISGAQTGAPPPMNRDTILFLCGLAGVIEMVAHEHKIPCEEYPSLAVSKWFLGSAPKGRDAKKKATVKMCQRLGYEVRDDNAADAVAIALYAEMKHWPREAAGRASGRPVRVG